MAKRKKPAKLVDFKKRTEPDNALIQMEEYDPDLEIDDEENLKELMALGFTLMPETAMQDSRLHYKAKALYSHLLYDFNEEGAYPNSAEVMDFCDLTRDKYFEYLSQLVELGYIKAQPVIKYEGQEYKVYAINRFTGEEV